MNAQSAILPIYELLPMKSFFVSATLFVAMLCGVTHGAEAGSYLFERSYYSHAPASPVVIGHRAPVGGPLFMRPQGAAATSGYRWNRSNISVGGQVVDQLNTWDTWVQFYGKY